MLLSMIPDQYPNYYKALEIYTGYFDSLDKMILFSYPRSIIITRDYCTVSEQSQVVFIKTGTLTLTSMPGGGFPMDPGLLIIKRLVHACNT